jgi:hypothetical protein
MKLQKVQQQGQMTRVQFLTEVDIFLSSTAWGLTWGSNLSSIQGVLEALLLGVKQLEHVTGHKSPASVKGKKAKCNTFTRP